jgi:hypothetical protein
MINGLSFYCNVESILSRPWGKESKISASRHDLTRKLHVLSALEIKMYTNLGFMSNKWHIVTVYEKCILYTEGRSFAMVLQGGKFTLTFIWVGRVFKFYCMVYKIISITWT